MEYTENQLKELAEHEFALARADPTWPKPEVPIQKKEKIDDPVEHYTLVSQITTHLQNIGVPQENIDKFFSLNQGVKTLKKVLVNLPSKEDWERFSKLPKTQGLTALKTLKLPILYGWTVDEIVEALQSFVGTNAKKYYTERFPFQDCAQNAVLGIFAALKTDIGQAPFANHAFLHIRTNVRRPSVNSRILRQKQAPSKIEVRRVITQFLTGILVKNELDKKISKLSKGKFQNITEADVETIQKAQEAVQKHIKTIEKIAKTTINTRNILGLNDLHICKVQETGNSNAYETFVRLDFELKSEIKTNLLAYLTYKFKTQFYDITFVSDLIDQICSNPDFHGNPLDMSMSKDDEGDLTACLADKNTPPPDEAVITKDYRDRVAALMKAIVAKVPLTKNQEIIRDYRFGLNGTQALDSALLADHFGKFTGEDKGVSRQRISQYEDAIKKKYLEAAFDELALDPKFPQLMQSARKLADLTKTEDTVLSLAYGLDKGKWRILVEVAARLRQKNLQNLLQTDLLDYIADHREIFQFVPDLDTIKRRHFVREILTVAKKKVLQALIG